MVTAQKSATDEQFYTATHSFSDDMSILQATQDYSLFSSVSAAYADSLWHSPTDLHTLNSYTRDAIGSSHNELPGVVENPGLAFSHEFTSTGSEKRFLIFDKSGDQMNLFLSPSVSLWNTTSRPLGVPSAKFLYEDDSVPLDQQSPTHNEKWDENHLPDEGSETGEDTEEINALLDSDEDYSDEDYEVTSRCHSPCDEFTNCESLPKRRRLLDENYCFVSGDVDSRYSSCECHSKREKEAEIYRVLKIMESILPCSDNKDPLSIIDTAIAYLKSMKAEAKDIGLIPTTFV